MRLNRHLMGVTLLAILALLGGGACDHSSGSGDDGGPDDAGPVDGATTDGGLPDGAPLPDGAILPDGGSTDGQVGEVCNGLDDDGDGLVDEGLEAFCGGCGRPYDLAVTAPYPIYGTWMFGRGDDCAWQDAMEDFHRQGGESVWQFGPHFEVHTANEIRAHVDFAACTEGSVHCVDAALAELQAVNAGNTVANYLTYNFGDAFSDTIMTCPALDRKIIVGSRTYWRIVLPHNVGQTVCDFNGGSFDILFVWAEGADNKEMLLRAADGLQMEVYLGMPGAPQLPHPQTWNVDTALRPAFLDWSRRVLEDYDFRLGAHPSFAGVYQAFEVMLMGSGLDAIYDTYELLVPVLHAALPGRLYAVSPYWDVNVDHGNATVASAKAGFKRLARLGVDVIAPQDGRGTGKAALFWPYQEDTVISTVDPRLATFPNVVGTRTFSQQFNASTQELFWAMRDAVTELDTQEGIGVTLWANIEAFEGTTTAPCGFPWSRDRTDKERIDRALAFAGAYPTRIISFMWDAYYTCTDGGYSQSLHDEIMADHSRPIANQAFFWNGGLVVRGFHLTAPGTTFNLTWYDGSWTAHSTTVTPGSTAPGWGASHDRSPMLDEVSLPFDSSNLAPNFYVHITAVGPGTLTANHTFSMAY
jgi:Domain of unknown function (DUF4434)